MPILSVHVINEHCLSGSFDLRPCLIPLIYDIRLRFAMGKMGLVADMRKNFLEINIAKDYQDQLDLIWLDKLNHDKYI